MKKPAWYENVGGWGDRAEGRAARPFADGEPPNPLHREIRPGSPYPVDALPDVMRRTVEDVGIITQAPVELIATSALAAAATLAQGIQDVVHPATGRVSPCSLFFASLAETGERKSTVEGELFEPIKKWEKHEWQEYKKRAAEKSKREKDHEGGYQDEDGNLIFEDEDKQPTILVNDTTAEGLVKLLGCSIDVKCLATSEGGVFTGGHAMRDEGRSYTVSVVCSLWDGAEVRRHRAKENDPPLFGKRLSMSIAIQPKLGLEWLRTEGLSEQGFSSRLLTCYPESKIGSRSLEAGFEEGVKAARERLRRGWEPKLKHLLDCLKVTGGSPLGTALEFSADARERYRTFYNEIERAMGKNRSLSNAKELANKMAEQAVRIAAIIVIFNDPNANLVELRDMEAAIALAEYYLSEGLRLIEVSAIDKETKDTLEIWGFVKRVFVEHEDEKKRRSVFYLKEIYDRGPRSIRDASVARKAIGVLVEHGFVRKLPKTRIDGRVRSECWEIRVEALADDPHRAGGGSE